MALRDGASPEPSVAIANGEVSASTPRGEVLTRSEIVSRLGRSARLAAS
jgi:hypothetical protein